MAKNLILEAKGKKLETSTKSDESLGFLTSIAKNMEVADADGGGFDLPRVPSILSPAYSFYIALTNKVENDAAHVRAQKELRGLAAVLILRNLLQVEVRQKTWAFNSSNAYAPYFKLLYQNEVGFNQPWWRDGVRYVEVKIGGEWKPLCLLSPLTLVCPTVSPPPAIGGVFWYDGKGNWEDPLKAPCDNAPFSEMVRGSLRAWLDDTVGGNLHAALVAALGSNEFADGLKDKFFDSWLEDAGNYPPTNISLAAAAKDLFGPKIIPIVDRAIAAAAPQGPSSSTVINLKPFFLEKLYRLSDRTLDDPWIALTRGAKGEESLLLPFKPEILNHLSADKVFDRGALPWSLTEQGGTQTVNLTHGSVTEPKSYTSQTDITFASRNFDIRIWPNRPEHRGTYFFRIKQDPNWNLQLALICKEDASGKLVRKELKDGAEKTGWKSDGAGGPRHRAKFYTFDAVDCEPVGLIFENRGLLFFKWKHPVGFGTKGGVRLGIDFGTTHTCVCINDPPKLGHLKIRKLTTVLNKIPNYQYEKRDVDEGGLAVLDFPFNLDNWERDTDNSPTNNEEDVVNQAYFPSLLTLWATNVGSNVRGNDKEHFKFSYGLIFPRNCYLAENDVGKFLRDYPVEKEQIVPEDRNFHLVPNLKWDNRIHRLAFLQHLQKMISSELASMDRTIDSIAFSFPRAFDGDVQGDFEAQCRDVFKEDCKIENIEHISESEAVLRKVCWDNKNIIANSDRLILDVGGGTTDLLFTPLGRNPGKTVQASYEFAGGVANAYFAKSVLLREWMFSKVVIGDSSSLDRWHEPDSEYSKQLFFGLLSKIGAGKDYQTLSPARLDVSLDTTLKKLGKDAEKTIFGFYYTIILLFSGMSHMGGRLVKAAKEAPSNLRVDLIGNGANFYTLLPQPHPGTNKVGFDAIMNAVFAKSSGFTLRPKGFKVQGAMAGANTEINWVRESDSKKWVAEGLALQAQKNPDGVVILKPGEVPVPTISIASLADVAGNLPDDKMFDPDTQMKELGDFLDTVHENLENGKIKGDDRTALPMADGIPGDFREEIFRDMKSKLEHALREAKANYETARLKGDNEISQSREPGFVVALREYVWAVQRLYAK